MNEISITNTGLSALLHSGAGLPATLMRDIFLTEQSVVGTRYQGGAEDLVEELTAGSRVTLLHESDNRFDSRAVVVMDEKGRKLGYIPRHQNAVIAALLDAGKVFYGLLKETPARTNEEVDTSPYRFRIDLYMREFTNPEEMNTVPVHGDRGSYAVVAIETEENFSDSESGEPDEAGRPGKRAAAKRDSSDSESGETDEAAICGLYAIKIINGEERGHFYRALPRDVDWEADRETGNSRQADASKSGKALPRDAAQDADREVRREMFREFDEFTGYLPFVGHGIEGRKLKMLQEEYGVLLGAAFPNIVIDTEQMGRVHMPWVEDDSLEAYAEELGIECAAESDAERECRIVWQLYRRMERSELERVEG